MYLAQLLGAVLFLITIIPSPLTLSYFQTASCIPKASSIDWAYLWVVNTISEIISVLKKNDKSIIEKYRSVANLCSSTKIFEILLMKGIEEMQFLFIKSLQ